MLTFKAEKDETEEHKGRKTTPDVTLEYSSRLTELEKELQFTKESLQATVEELETSNEELQSSNEELIASNEELQSTNEELQSVNEELYTINSEYQVKIDELTRLNNDVNNLLKNTEIGALYLDRNLCIRKLTPVVSKITNILPTDIGRPISHLSVIKSYDSLLSDVDRVIETLVPADKEIIDAQGVPYLTKIRPYRTEYNSVEGVLITFVDITRIKKLEHELRQSRDLFQKILDNSPLAKTFVDSGGNITYANKRAEELFGLTQEQILKRTYDAAAWKITDLEGNLINPEELPFSQIKKTGREVYGYKHYIEVPGRDKVLLKINGAPMRNMEGGFEGAVFSIECKNINTRE